MMEGDGDAAGVTGPDGGGMWRCYSLARSGPMPGRSRC